ncbi:hypothetical protein [Streptomyces phaeochromogenes]|uniref:hypothetical protein n=1 Tax=Streptomyces phaeochromogenes TaxID=1923 RepID=UPI003F4CBDBC
MIVAIALERERRVQGPARPVILLVPYPLLAVPADLPVGVDPGEDLGRAGAVAAAGASRLMWDGAVEFVEHDVAFLVVPPVVEERCQFGDGVHGSADRGVFGPGFAPGQAAGVGAGLDDDPAKGEAVDDDRPQSQGR